MSVKNTSVVEWFIMVRIGRIVEPVVLGLAHVDDEHRQAVGALLGLFLRRGARQQDHQVGIFGAAGPDLLAVDDVAVVAVALGKGLQRGGVGAAGRLGDAERLQPQFAAGDLRQPFCLLLVAAVPQQRAHGVHLGVAAAAIAAGALDLFEDRGRGRQFQPGAAIFFRDQHREIAGFGQRIDEGLRVGHLAVELAPVFAGELRAKFGDGVADVGIVVLFGCVSSELGWQIEGAHGGGAEGAEAFGSSSLVKTSTVATPIEPDIFRVLARAISSWPSAGLRKLTLISTVTPIRPAGKRGNGDPGGLIGQRGNDAAVEMAEELHQVVAARQRDFGKPGSTATMRKPAASENPSR